MTPFQQKDPRWGAEIYSSVGNQSQTIGTSGCGLLALTNAIYSITSGKIFLEPVMLDKLSVANGFRTPNDGTSWSFADWYVKNKLSEEFFIIKTFDTDKAISSLKSGKCVIYTACHGNSERIFTTAGHYVAINDYTSDGYFSVLDSDFYSGKYDVGYRVSEQQKKRLAVNNKTKEIWCKPELFKQEMNGIGYVIITYSPKNEKESEAKKMIETKEQAIQKLTEKGIINTPDYWLKACDIVKNLDALLIKFAGAI